MNTLGLCGLAMFLTYTAARRSLPAGLVATIAVGYTYRHCEGEFSRRLLIFHVRRSRARSVCWPAIPSTATSRAARRSPAADVGVGARRLAGPTVNLPCSGPTDSSGWSPRNRFCRFCVWVHDFEARDLRTLAVGIAVLNLCAAALAGLEFVVGIERFFPRNVTTDGIYNSNDVAGFTAYRIPSSFSSAHAYAGTMVHTLPLLIGASTSRTGRDGRGCCFLRHCWRLAWVSSWRPPEQPRSFCSPL